ncbi:MAG: nuclear transport factor 2 family protein [Planctomycetota bacterium]
MIRLTAFTSLIASVVLLTSLAPDEKKAPAKSSAETFLLDWGKRFEAGDIEKILACYESSKDLVTVHSVGRVIRGIEDARKYYVAGFRGIRFDSVELKKLQVKENGNTAWASCRFFAETSVVSNGDRYELEIFTTLVLERKKGQWKIVLEHSSTIEGVPRLKKL